MSTLTIAVLVGSLRKDSLNGQLVDALATMLPDGVKLERQRIDDLPHYNQDDDGHPPAAVTRLKNAIQAADGVLFVTPEYNRSIPGVLKNAIDHASRPYGKSAFAGKPAGVLGVSIGVIGTACAQQHLRPILAYLDMPTFNQPEAYLHAKEGFFESPGKLGESSQKFVQKWLDGYLAWVERFASN